jgi:hypothetical protein
VKRREIAYLMSLASNGRDTGGENLTFGFSFTVTVLLPSETTGWPSARSGMTFVASLGWK